MKGWLVSMRTSDRMALDNILLHKEYFDQKLIEIIEHLIQQAANLSKENERLKFNNQELKKKNSELRAKAKDLKSIKYGYDQKYKDLKKENEVLSKYLKEAQKEINKLKKEHDKQKKKIEKLKKDIEDYCTLIDQLKHCNSTNSNFPSSMDVCGHSKPKVPDDEGKSKESGRNRGGQKNHPVHRSKLTKEADNVKTLKVKKAPKGAIPVKNEDGSIEYYVTQEVDVVLKKVVSETRYYIDSNGEELDKETLNKYAINPLTYSADFKTTAVYLNQKGTIPLQRLCDMMKEMSKGDIQLQPSTIIKWCKEFHKKSTQSKEDILREILQSPVIHVDETGFRINGELHWIHTITNENGSIFLITSDRGDKDNGPLKLLSTYTGYLVHDHFSSYQNLKLCKHVECNAHIDRYMKRGIDFEKSEDCKELLDLMHGMLHRKNELIDNEIFCMSNEEKEDYISKFKDILENGLAKYEEENPNVQKVYEPKFVKTFRRMLADTQDYLRFIEDFIVPYTNNNAERQCRSVKAKKNASGQFVSVSGGEAYVSILSILQTAKLKNENAYEALRAVFQ